MEAQPVPAGRGATPVPTLGHALALFQAGETDAAIAEAGRIVSAAPENADAWQIISLAHYRAGRFAPAIEAGRRMLALAPSAAGHANLGVILRAAGRGEEAKAAYREALSCDAGFSAAHYNLGNLLRADGDAAGAERCYREAVRHNPDYAEAWRNLGNLLQASGRIGEALTAFQRASALNPNDASIMADVATCLMGVDRNDEARSLFEQAIGLDPKCSAALGNLGALLLRGGLTFEAREVTARAKDIDPKEPRWLSNLATIAKDLGAWDEAEALFRRALAMRPDYAVAHANLLFCINYHPDRSAEEVFTEYRRFDRAHAVKHMPAGPPVRPALAGRKLRLGLLSPDFREHSARHFIGPMLEGFDRSRIELFCYAEVASPDAVTERFKGLAGQWRSTVGLSDAAVAEQIRRDGIDVLMDLGGHTAGSRILVLAHKPAPVQVAHLLGHAYSSGLSAADVFLADKQLVPVGSEPLFSERVVRLPRIPIAYAPDEGMPEPSAPPCLSRGYVTFGHFGRPERVNERVISCWSRILRGVPNSRLVLNTKALREPAFRDLMLGRFAAHGIDASRLDLIYTAPQPRTWEAYAGIDIALDPFPHNAGTTTIEALWLGVPVLTLKDRPSVGRFGASILASLGLTSWIAESEDDYVTRAVAFASDITALGTLRAGLRRRFLASPLADRKDLAKHIEAICYEIAGQAEQARTHRAMAMAKDASGHLGDALAAWQQVIALRPQEVEAWTSISDLCRRLGRLAEAEQAARKACLLSQDAASACNALGTALTGQNRLLEAEAAFGRALAADATNVVALNNRALSYFKRGSFTLAEADFRAAMALRPDQAEISFNLGAMLLDVGRARESLDIYRAALRAAPAHARGHGMMLFCLNYQASLSAEEIAREYVRWYELHGAPHAPADPRWDNDLTPGRRLRVGYVSPDFCTKSGRHFIEPMLRGHDRSAVEVFCYAEVARPDAETERLKRFTDHWRSTVGLSADAMADMIRRDRIDVLVDLGGHTSNNRLDAMVRRPAPVQLVHILGLGYSSGIGTMDGFIADQDFAPAGSDGLFAEPVIRLPRIPYAYAPPEGMPEVSPAPALKNGFVTFGHFGRPARLNDDVIACWARILLALPTARLVLNAAPFGDAGVVERCANLFISHGITRDRVDFLFTTPQPETWKAYERIDIALDPFPHNAGTTTIEALWMGLPVVSLNARPPVGRFGASILGATGSGGWVADTVEDYCAKAVALASDVEALDRQRQSLRQRFRNSPLFDGEDLARAQEQAYRTLWQRHCARETDAARLHREGVEAFGRGKVAEAAALLRQAASLVAHADILCDLGVVLRAAGDRDGAEAAYRAALARKADLPQALNNLANSLVQRGERGEAEALYRRCLALTPDDAAVMHSLAVALMASNRMDEALPLLQRAIASKPDSAEFIDALAMLHRQNGEPVRAAALYDAHAALMRDYPRGLNNSAIASQDVGRIDEAEALFRRALELRPDYAVAHANLLFCLNYHPDRSAEEVFAEYRRFDRAHAVKHMPAGPPVRPALAGRKLRLGLLSPDFREHSARHFIGPMLAGFDHSRIEVFCYAEVASPDAVTERFKALASHWRSTVGLSDAAVAEQIRRDGIDVLMDLGGHTAGSRLLVLAHRPAPVQIAHLLGHAYTSGLSAADAFLADEQLVPQGSEHLFSERIVRLPRIPIAYAPDEGMPQPSPAPCLSRGYVTFGHFGRPERVNERVISCWSRILRGVPNSRLVLNTKALREPAFRDLMLGRFARNGIDASRLDLVYTSPQPRTWDAYAGIDIALDPFPHNAGTTTIEALWLGVPVLTLKDRPSVGRFGASILTSLGLADWIAETEDDYVARAVAFASDTTALGTLRAGLRRRFLASPLADGKDLAKHIETVCYELCGEPVATPSRPATLDRAIAAFRRGDMTEAWLMADTLLRRSPADGPTLHLRGLAAFNQGRLAEAADDLLAAVKIAPRQAEWHWNLTAVLSAAGRLEEAVAHGERAIALAPKSAAAHNNLGSVYRHLNRRDEAETCFRAAIKFNPDHIDAWSNLALLLAVAGRAHEAEAAARKAIALAPHDANSYNNLGNALLQQERLTEARDAFAQSVKLAPRGTIAHSNLLFCLNYIPGLSERAIAAAYRQWYERHARPLMPARPAHANDRNPHRRLKIGYVSPDFRNHAVTYFVEPLLAAHDRESVEVTCYAEVASPDAVTERLKGLVDHWRPTVGMSDADLAERIRSDGIDVLVDLAGHTSGNRLLVFARRPAPVQIAHMVGSGTTTGLSAFDGFLTDEYFVPVGNEDAICEPPLRLSRIPLAYRPPEGMPGVSPLPALAAGHITFGSFSRTMRINDSVVGAWAEILKRVPNSRLFLNSKPFQEGKTRRAFHERFAGCGIGADRLDLVYTTPQPATWAAYGRLDIALDPFPHNAGTTTFEALWMGVPVVSLAARPPVGRFGASILSNLGMADWCTESVEAYIARAVAAASDVHALADVRSTLRQRFRASPLCDAAGLACEIEALYRQMWQRWLSESEATQTRRAG